MIGQEFLYYILQDGFNLESIPKIGLEESIIISSNGTNYSEALFDEESFDLSEEEKLDLLIVFNADCTQSQVNIEALSKLPLIKITAWFLTEQYLDRNKYDSHGRHVFPIENSFLLSVLEYPIVDVIAVYISDLLGIKRRKSEVFLTCDYDILDIWKSLGVKDSLRNIFGFARSSDLKGFFGNLADFISYKLHLRKVNKYLNDDMFVFNKEGVRNVAFWLVDSSNKSFDIENDFTEEEVINFINNLSKKGVDFGLHPSYNTLTNPAIFEEQKDKFVKLFKFSPVLNRFHFLRINYPFTLFELERNGFKDDFSFYFAETMSFRAGKSSPFRYWDFIAKKPIEVIIHPITIMESTLFHYLKLSETEAVKVATKKIKRAKHYGTEVNLLWHNRSMYQFGFPHNYYHKIYTQLLTVLFD